MPYLHSDNYYNETYNETYSETYSETYNDNYNDSPEWRSPPNSPEWQSSNNSPEWQSPNNSPIPRPPPSTTSLHSNYHFHNNQADDLLNELEEWVRELRWLIAYGAGEQRAAGHGLLEDAGLRLWRLNMQLGAAVGALEESGLGAVLRRNREGGGVGW